MLSKMLRPEWRYFDLENPQTYDQIHDDLNFFFKQINETLAGRVSMVELSPFKINKQLQKPLPALSGTIKNYLDIAHGTIIWRNIPAYERSKVKSPIKMPKGIFRDSGLNNYLQNKIRFRS